MANSLIDQTLIKMTAGFWMAAWSKFYGIKENLEREEGPPLQILQRDLFRLVEQYLYVQKIEKITLPNEEEEKGFSYVLAEVSDEHARSLMSRFDFEAFDQKMEHVEACYVNGKIFEVMLYERFLKHIKDAFIFWVLLEHPKISADAKKIIRTVYDEGRPASIQELVALSKDTTCANILHRYRGYECSRGFSNQEVKREIPSDLTTLGDNEKEKTEQLCDLVVRDPRGFSRALLTTLKRFCVDRIGGASIQYLCWYAMLSTDAPDEMLALLNQNQDWYVVKPMLPFMRSYLSSLRCCLAEPITTADSVIDKIREGTFLDWLQRPSTNGDGLDQLAHHEKEILWPYALNLRDALRQLVNAGTGINRDGERIIYYRPDLHGDVMLAFFEGVVRQLSLVEGLLEKYTEPTNSVEYGPYQTPWLDTQPTAAAHEQGCVEANS